jgi:hypothetical protein
MRASLLILSAFLTLALPAAAQEDEIVANLAGGRVVIHVATDGIVLGAIDHPLEATRIPLRVAAVDAGHLGVFFGASEWQVPAQPRPIRLDRDIERVGARDQRYMQPGTGEVDLEQIGVVFLEKLRPLVAQLHHKIDLKPDEPLLEIVVIGYAPHDYGPEVWTVEYRVEQQAVGARPDYLETHVLRARFTQLYPPEKHEAHTLVEARFPNDLQTVPLLGLIQQNDPRVAKIISSDPRFGKAVDLIEKGQAQKVNTKDASDFMRAVLPILAGGAPFSQGVMGENGTFDWVVPPEEAVDKVKQAEDKNRPPEAPTLRRKPSP